MIQEVSGPNRRVGISVNVNENVNSTGFIICSKNYIAILEHDSS